MNRIIVIYLVRVLLFSFWLVWFALRLLGPACRLGVDNYQQAHRHPYYWGVF
jgi:hypothetical protein